MAETVENQSVESEVELQGGSYEVIRRRLQAHATELLKRTNTLNEKRKQIFGALDTRLLGQDQILTEANCVPIDMRALGNRLIFGYQVHVGLQSAPKVADVFGLYEFKDGAFEKAPDDFLTDPGFVRDFRDLFNYYKNSRFLSFTVNESRLLMIFQVGKETSDIRAFKWAIQPDGSIHYVNNRAEREYIVPDQHEFQWRRTTRDMHVQGKHPHISIEDRLFVECLGGDLTVKVENNTDEGAGIYSEPVEHRDQTLDDAEIHFAVLEHIVLLKIKPFREQSFRYIIYNEKTERATRIDEIADCAIRLPEGDGLIFSHGYYLETGEFKRFELETARMYYRKRLASSNGEDFLYVFVNDDRGEYILLQYNLIEKRVENPIHCNGFAVYEDGRLVFTKSDQKARRNHAIQIWQTPFASEEHLSREAGRIDSPLGKIGNRGLVRGIADLRAIYNLLQADRIYLGLYHQIVRRVTNTLDFHHWLGDESAEAPAEILQEISRAARSALDEYEKVLQIQKSTENELQSAEKTIADLELSLGGRVFDSVDGYVEALAALRGERGRVVTLRDLRYIDNARVDRLEKSLDELQEHTAQACVTFLSSADSLKPFHEQLDTAETDIPEIKTALKARELGEKIEKVNESLNLLSELVNSLEIEDATATTAIIDRMSAVYGRINQVRAQHKNHFQSLRSSESKAEFSAQLKLLAQTVSNSLDRADSPERCDELLSRVLVQLEELEGRFAELPEFTEELGNKREEIYSAFNNRRVSLEEARNKRTQTLWNSADRILKSISGRLSQFKEVEELNAYFAGDVMVGRVRDIVEQLKDAGDSVRSEDVAGRLKSLRQDGARQLKDRIELFAEGENVISLGEHKFLVAAQDVELTTVRRDDQIQFHLTGTDFFEAVEDEEFARTRPFWDQEWISENSEVYRAEFLAHRMLHLFEASPSDERIELLEICRGATRELSTGESGESFASLLERVQAFAAGRYEEGYDKGVHDQDATRILAALYPLYVDAGPLRFHPTTRSLAYFFWHHHVFDDETAGRRDSLGLRIRSLGVLESVTGKVERREDYLAELGGLVNDFPRPAFIDEKDFDLYIRAVAQYLFEELKQAREDGAPEDSFRVSEQAFQIYRSFREFLKKRRAIKKFDSAVASVGADAASRIAVTADWLRGFLENRQQAEEESKEAAATVLQQEYYQEAASLIFRETLDDTLDGDWKAESVRHAETRARIAGLLGQHDRLNNGELELDLGEFLARLTAFGVEYVPGYRAYIRAKHALLEDQKDRMRLESFKPKVMSAFVRNRLIDTAYLPLVGANLAKQMGSYGDAKRTDLMGLLLLISPPGYGKTTLMEYIANRLGLIFMKINGPAIGHHVTSLDPDEAPNATAREEVQKLNLALEMGNNVMIYLDDIQHTNPEFLQKFISLCDAQRKIEGVYRGRTRTYDLRGKRVAVVMAGNPYTESGEKFQVPDMLANRADVYNLGDVLGGHEEAFGLSYLENALTSNAALAGLAARGAGDVAALIRVARSGSTEGVSFQGNYSPEEVKEWAGVFEKLLKIQRIVLQINQQYIYSAAQDDQFRTEPPFLLQGSYRNMNKMAEKVMAVMNPEEIDQLIFDHYNDESQLLTTGAEFNLLRFKELSERLTPEEVERLEFIREAYRRNRALGGTGQGDDPVQKIVGQINLFNEQFGELLGHVKKRQQ